MGKRWNRERRQDAYWHQAKRTGYRSRASFKLRQISQRYGILRKGQSVVDLGCAPGGWSQVALEVVGEGGAVVGVDLSKVRAMPPARFIRGDLTDEETLELVRLEIQRARAGPPERAKEGVDVVLSDMAPKISGVYSVDQARSVVLAGVALDAARALLRPGGYFVVKVFEGHDFSRYVEDVRQHFAFVKVHAPPASRKQSSEVYIVAKGFRGRRGRRRPVAEEE